MKPITICLLLVSFFQRSENYRILGIFQHPGKSHIMMFETLMKELAAKGHEVDVMCHFPSKEQVPRFNVINIQETAHSALNNVSMSFIKGKLDSTYKTIKYLFNEMGTSYCKVLFTSNVVNELKNTNKTYDLVITHLFGMDCMLGFAHYFEVPVVSIITSVNLPWGGNRVGNPDNPSYIPNYFLSYVNPFSFMERLTNTVTLLLSQLMYKLATKRSNPIARNFFGSDLPDLEYLTYNTSLVLVNSHFSINVARPNVPNFVEVGGLHIKPPKPLPMHLEHSVTLTSQHKGVIYLSMGSLLLSETLSPYALQALFEAFRELPYKILWKATRQNMPKKIDIPSNIHFEPWLPQLDVLCHPNTKLFITHGGLFGTQESVYCGVPSLGIPICADQQLNLRTSETKGFAIVVEYDKISKGSILNAANKLLEDPKYRSNVKIISKLFRDRPISALDTAIYWIEYVIRQRGAQHLRSIGPNLLWYQRSLIDVGIILLALISVIIIILIYCIRRFTLRTLFRSSFQTKTLTL